MSARHLYVHVPFCARRCSYCDFAIAVRRRVPVEEFLTALERELSMRLPEPLEVETVYLGGGTPSLLGSSGVSRLMDVIRRFARVAEGAEVTIEANPDDVGPAPAASWRAAGINRVSLGAQSFDPAVLSWMHRTHKSWQTAVAVDHLRSARIDAISVDLIFAIPDSLRRDWERDLTTALELRPDHISIYGLTVEPATPLARWVARGSASEAPEERYAAEFLRAHDLLSSSAYEHYEVSNYALSGSRSRHNSCYWSHAEYLGVGPSAHSFEGHVRSWNVAPYAEWVQRLGAGDSARLAGERLTAENLEAERVYLGLRTDRGVLIDTEAKGTVAPWLEADWATMTGSNLRLTPSGWLRLDALAWRLTCSASHSYI